MSTQDAVLQLPAPATVTKPQIRSLTGLRFFAALHVVVYHLWIHLRLDFAALPLWALNLITSGYLGVPLFFLLSGFVMAITYLKAPPGEPVSIQARRYWVARLARIYPVYVLSLVLSLPHFLAYKLTPNQGVWGTLKTLGNLALHGALLQSWYPKIMLDLNPPAWSLSVEAFFYATFPFLVGALGLTRLHRRGLLRAALGLWALSLTLTLLTMGVETALPGADHARIAGFRCVFPLLRLPDFLLGIALGRLFMLGHRKGSRSIRLMTWGTAIAALVAMSLTPETADQNLVSSLMLLPFGLLVYGLAHQGDGLSAMLSRPGTVLLGEASYSLYILHWPLLFAFQQGLSRLRGTVLFNPLVYQPFFTALAIGVSIATFRYLEAPLRERIKRAWG